MTPTIFVLAFNAVDIRKEHVLAKSCLIPLGLTPAASATVPAIHKKMFGSGVTTFVILSKEMNDIMEIVKSFEEYDLLLKVVSKTIKNEAKEQIGGFLRKLLDTLGASLLGNILTGKGIIKAGEGVIRVGQYF